MASSPPGRRGKLVDIFCFLLLQLVTVQEYYHCLLVAAFVFFFFFFRNKQSGDVTLYFRGSDLDFSSGAFFWTQIEVARFGRGTDC